MTEHSWRRGRTSGLTYRHAERSALDRLVDAVRAGESRTLVMRGDPGVGKTVLLDHLATRASDSGCRVARAAGVQSEMELAFAGLHQLCAPMLDQLSRIPVPQHDALRTAFGIAAGTTPDRFLVGLGVLSLLCEAADQRPLICVIDDERIWTGPRCRRWASRRDGWAPTRSASCSPRETRAASWPGLPSWTLPAWATTMRGSCWIQPSGGRSIHRSET